MNAKFSIIIQLILLFLPEISAQEKCDRTHCFPEHVEYLDTLPAKENIWVFIMAGQSNMAGRGIVEAYDTLSHPRVISLHKDNTWVYAKEPLHYYQPKITGLDCGMSFAKELLNGIDTSCVIALVPCAVGGSSIDYWLNDSVFNGIKLKSNYTEKVNLAKKHGTIKGILWHQGESDAFPNKIQNYEMKLETNFTFLRDLAGNDSLPIFVGELGSLEVAVKWRDNWDKINQIIKKVTSKDNNCYLIETSDLEQKCDSAHFNAKSQRILGKRYAHSFLETLSE